MPLYANYVIPSFLSIFLPPKPILMKIWFIRHNNESLGPYSLDELKTLSVSQDDYVWKQGFADWQQVKSVTELNEVSAPTPPPFTNNTNNGSTDTSSHTVQRGTIETSIFKSRPRGISSAPATAPTQTLHPIPLSKGGHWRLPP